MGERERKRERGRDILRERERGFRDRGERRGIWREREGVRV